MSRTLPRSGSSYARGRYGRVVKRPAQNSIRPTTDGFLNPAPAAALKPVPASRPTRTKSQARPALPRQRRSAVLSRQMLNGKASKRRVTGLGRDRKHRTYAIWAFCAAVIFISGSAASYVAWNTGSHTNESSAVLSDASGGIQDGARTVETELTKEDIAAYKVAPELPRIIRIPRLQVEARVRRLGASQAGVLKSPANIYDTGWYDGSSEMDELGTLLINGHMHGATKPGVFYRLSSLKEGDTIEIERGDGTVVTYSVLRVETMEQHAVDMPKLLKSAVPEKPGLNLLGYTDRYDVRKNNYEKQVAIYAVRQ